MTITGRGDCGSPCAEISICCVVWEGWGIVGQRRALVVAQASEQSCLGKVGCSLSKEALGANFKNLC